MEITARKSRLNGEILIPASKSHTIRAVLISALAEGVSEIYEPLLSLDTNSAVSAVRMFGAGVTRENDIWKIEGVAGKPCIPGNIVDVGNSGTTLYMIMGTAALVDGWTVLTGDEQIRRRTALPLIEALGELGAEVISTRGNGMAPLMVNGKMRGGSTHIAGISSQYVSSLLLSCPLAEEDTYIGITQLNERPYVQMTLDWLKYEGIRYEIDEDMTRAVIPGRQVYRRFNRKIPGDFSSATFPLCAGALAGGRVTLKGLEMTDPQGDKKVIYILREMGADIEIKENAVTVTGGRLKGTAVDMNEIPDALPMLSVTACFAEGTTVLNNVAQARIKETDRIAVMASELKKLGAKVKELPDGLEITGTGLNGGKVHGYDDHRVVMAMVVAGIAADGPITVDTAESADVTFPGFLEKMKSLGAEIEIKQP